MTTATVTHVKTTSSTWGLWFRVSGFGVWGLRKEGGKFGAESFRFGTSRL